MQAVSVVFAVAVAFCPSGQQLVGDVCEDCAIGFYKDNTLSEIGRFSQCTQCPDGFVTPAVGSDMESDCTVRKWLFCLLCFLSIFFVLS